ncbi:MAG: ABC transporter permease [Solirubrobacterales bacterium]|nr:ABC transporter permease [Solirubrobacterales bacterium]HMT05579.1 ABC transporter permease [Solirubrobacterales bacterium]
MAAPGTRARRVSAAVLPPLLFAVFVLGVWQLYTVIGDIKESTLPPPTAVAEALWNDRTMLLENAWVTIKEILIGFFFAIILGVGLAVLIRSSRTVERAIYPWLVVSQMVPIPAIAPLLIIWFGFEMQPKIIVIMLVSFFPIAVNTIDGLRAAEPELLNLLKTLKANKWQRFRKAQLPAALPFLFSGLKVAAALSVIGAVFAEWVGASEGLGYLILVLNNQTATTEMFAVIVTLASIGIALFLIVTLLERLLLPWYYESRESEGEGLHLEIEDKV